MYVYIYMHCMILQVIYDQDHCNQPQVSLSQWMVSVINLCSLQARQFIGSASLYDIWRFPNIGLPMATPKLRTPAYIHLVGGLDHFLFFHILGTIIPFDFHIFQKG